MTIHVRTPFALDKNLGREYNNAFKDVDENDWVCLRDHDSLFLTSDAIPIMYEYVNAFPDTGIFTAWCNRIHPLSVNQLFLGSPSNDFDIKNWEYRARIQSKTKTIATEINHPISGFLMLISKKTWNEIKFMEGHGCLGIDNFFSQEVLKSGRKILRMDRLVVWHSYRLNNITDKSHLK